MGEEILYKILFPRQGFGVNLFPQRFPAKIFFPSPKRTDFFFFELPRHSLRLLQTPMTFFSLLPGRTIFFLSWESSPPDSDRQGIYFFPLAHQGFLPPFSIGCDPPPPFGKRDGAEKFLGDRAFSPAALGPLLRWKTFSPPGNFPGRSQGPPTFPCVSPITTPPPTSFRNLPLFPVIVFLRLISYV